MSYYLENNCLHKNKARNLAGLHKLWKETDEYYNSTTSKRVISYEAMQFLQYWLQKKPKNRLNADELYEFDFIQNAYNDEEYTMPDKHSECKLYLTKHAQFD